MDANIEIMCSPKKEIPGNMGFVAYFLDTEKNVMGLWSMK
jgi:predicted enzyme related to lactoylglutathione lyase